MKTEWQDTENQDAYVEEMIRRAEAGGLIRAPKHMKQDILKRVERPEYQIALRTREFSKNVQLLFYSLKVGAAVVMALFLLFMVPRELPKNDFSLPGKEPGLEFSIGDILDEGLRDLNHMLGEWPAQYRDRQNMQRED